MNIIAMIMILIEYKKAITYNLIKKEKLILLINKP